MPQVGSAWIQVTPSLKGFSSQLRRDLKRELAGVRAEVKIEGDFDGVKRGATEAGVEAGGEFSRGFKKRVEAALKALPDVKIDADSSPAQREIAAIRAELQTLSEKTVGIDLDAGQATAKLTQLRERLDRLGAEHTSVDLDIDVGAASAQLSAVERQVSRLDGRKAKVNVDVDRDGDAQRASFFLTQQINGLVLAGAGVAPVLVPAFAVSAAAAIGLAGAVAGAGAGIAALALVSVPAFTAVSDAVKATDQAEKASATSAVTTTRQRVQAAYQAQQAAQRVADAQQSADRTAVEGARRVQDAQRSLGDTRREVSERIEAANEKVADSERQLERSHEAVQRAQEDLTRAREDAIRTLRDLREETSDLALSEEGAEIALIEARQDLTKVNRDATATQLDRRKAALAVAEAEDRLSDVQRDQQRTRKELNDAERVGINGSEQVLSANERLVDAQQGLADAQRGRTQAQRDLARAEADGARSISDAVRALSDARTQAAQSNADAARQVADALQAQTQQAEMARLEAENGITANRNLAYQLGLLTPLQRQLYDGWIHLRDGFKLWAATLEPAVIPLFLAGMQLVEQLLPTLTPLVLAAADGFRTLLDRATVVFQSPLWQSFMDFLARVAAPAIADFGTILLNLALGFAGILMAFEPFSTRMTGGLVDLTARFAEWGAGLGESEGFHKFIDYINEVWPPLKETLKAIGRALIAIVEAMAPLGGGVSLSVLRGIADWIADMDPKTIQAIALTLGGVALAMKAIGLVAAVSALGPWGIAIIAIGAAVAWAYTHFEGFRDVIQGFVDWVKEEVVPRLQAFGQAIVDLFEEEIRPKLEDFWAWFQEDIVPVLKDIGDVLLEVFRRVGEWFERNWPTIQNFIEGYVAYLKWAWDTIVFPYLNLWWNILSKVIGPVLLWLWHNVVEPAFKAIAAVIAFAWNYVIKPVLNALAWFIEFVLGPVVDWLWNKVIKPAWSGISAAISFAWNYIIKPVLAAIGWFISNVLAPVISWLWRNIVKPVFEAIWKIIQFAWNNVIKPIFDAINWFVRTILVPVFLWLKDRVVTVWDRIKDGIQTAWHFIRDRILKPAKSFIETVVDKFIWMKNRIGDAFGAVKRIASDVWDRITDIIRGAVNVAIKIINKIGNAIETVAGALGIHITIRDIPTLRDPNPAPARSVSYQRAPRVVAAAGAVLPATDPTTAGPFVTNGPRAIVGEGNPRYPEWVIPSDPKFRSRALGLFAQLGTRLMASGGTTRPRGPGIAGLYPPLATAVAQVIQRAHGAVSISSGWRSSEQQARLYHEYRMGRGNLAARPGSSQHEGGNAVDFGGNQSLYTRLASQLGLIHPVSGEPWHWEKPGQGRAGGGGIIGSGAFSSVADLVSKVVDAARGIGDIGWKFLRGAAGWVKDTAIKWVKDKADTFLTDTLGLGGDQGGPGGRELPAGAAGNRAAAKTLADSRGWTGAQWDALNRLIMSESGWDNTAQNPRSTAYGIFQFLNGTWAGTGYRKTSDPRTQILAGFKYIAQRYGDPIHAWAYHQAHNSYEQGGILPFLGSYQTGLDRVPHDGLVFAHRDEAILNPTDAAMFRQAGLDSVKGGRNFEQHNTYNGIVDYGEIARRTADDLAWQATVGSH